MSLTKLAHNALSDQFDDPTVHKALAVLTSRQRTFVIGIMVQGLAPSAAAREAGYASGNSASVLMRNELVREAIQAMQLRYAQDLELTIEDVKEGMLDAINVGRATNNAMAMIAGWREVGKLIGAYVEPEKNININVNDAQSLKNIPTEKLMELISPEVIEGEYEDVQEED